MPVATVHTRLARAHAKLRERLDREFNGRAAWIALLTCGDFAAPDAPGGGGSATAGSTTAATAATGGALMIGTLAKAGVAVAVLALVAWLWRRGAVDDGAADGASASAPAKDESDARKRRRAAAPVVPDTGEALVGADPERDLVGIVVDPEGKPVAGAELAVFAYRLATSGLPVETWSLTAFAGPTTTSRDDGTFALRLERGACVDVRVAAKGFATAQHVLRSAGERTRIELRRGVGLDLVCASADGSPVAGVSVLALTWPPGREPRVVRRATSDADGKLGWSDLPPGVRLHLHPTGWREGMEIDLPAEGRAARTLPFGRGRTIEGVVLDAATGVGVADARVDVGPPADAGVATAADGTFRLVDWMGRATDEIDCLAPGYARAVVRAGEGRLEIRLAKGVRATGRLVDAEGAPVAGAVVSATASFRDTLSPRRSWAFALSGADGRFELVDLASDLAHRLVVASHGHARVDRQIVPSAADVDLGDVVLAAPRAIAGRIVDGDDGVPRADVSLRPGDGSFDRVARRTDDRGRFRFDGLAPGTYVVSAGGAGERTVTVADADVVDLVLGDASGADVKRLVVRVVDNDGAPVPGVMVSVSHPPKPSLFVKADAAGVARFEAPRKRLFVQTSPPDAKRAWLQARPSASVYVDAEATEVKLVLEVGRTISGRLLGADGRPVVAARVGTWLEGGGSAFSETGKDGSFAFAVPATGTYVIRWTGQRRKDPERGFEMLDTREEAELAGVAPGATGVELRARRVEENQSLRVRVVGPDGAPIEGLGVWAIDLAVNLVDESGRVRATTDADGRATLVGMPGRPHRIGTGQRDRLYAAAWREARPGATEEITLALRATAEIRGVIVDAEGRPFRTYEAAGKKLTVNPWARNQRGSAYHQSLGPVDADGRFTILVPIDDEGPFTVEFNLAVEKDMQTRGFVEGVRAGGPEIRLEMRPRPLGE